MNTDFIPKWLTKRQMLDKILFVLEQHTQRMDKMAVSLADLDAAIAAENTKLTSLDALANQLVTDVAALVAKNNAGADFTNELNAVQAGATLLDNSLAAVTSADTAAKG